jgi:hypothetical protein
MVNDTAADSTHPQTQLADFCEWFLEDTHRPCYAPARMVLVRPSGETLRFTREEHAPAWANRVQGAYELLERAEWIRRGAGYRGWMLGQ